MSPKSGDHSDGSNHKIEKFITRTLVALILASSTAAVINVYLGVKSESDRIAENKKDDAQQSKVDELLVLEKQIELDVVQVQQYLTDVSATRAQNGLNDGWEQAAKHAEAFKTEAVRARQLATELGADRLAVAVAATEGKFPDFYETGTRMSHAYVDGGPAAGNAMMPRFDAAAEAMTSALDSTRSALAAAVKINDVANKAREQELLDSQRNGVILTALAALLTAIGGMAVIRSMRTRLLRPLSVLVRYMGQIANGDYSHNVPVQVTEDELGQMASAVTVFRHNGLDRQEMRTRQEQQDREQVALREEQATVLAKAAADQKAVVGGLAQRLQAMAAGDLNVNITEFFPEDYKRLRMDFNSAIHELSDALVQIRDSSEAVADAASQIAAGSSELARRAEHQAATLEETAAAHNQITATVVHTLSVAKETSKMVSAARAGAEKSRGVVGETVAAIHSIEQSSRQITQIIGVIDEIAFQTNLLALNAGVEAARAGDAGRGFAVVASEVRALAQRSADAAKQIKSLIGDSATAVERGVELVGVTGAALNDIVDQVSAVAERVHEIAASAAEQARGLEEVNVAITNLDTVTQQNAAVAEESNAAASTLSDAAERLVQLVSKFRIGDEGQRYDRASAA